MNAQCPCFTVEAPAKFAEANEAFYSLRKVCPALRFTIPDNISARHQEFTTAGCDDANHASVPYLAFRQGRLRKFTGIFHRFVVDATDSRKEVSQQYRRDLQETWIFESDSTSRFRKARSYLARIFELEFAQWLQNKRWQLDHLELYGGSFDVEATSHEGISTAFEVKFLAQREVVFELNRDAFTQATFGYLGVYSPIDYLILRLYEAALKLRQSSARRIAVAIVSDYRISYEIPLSEKWVDWKHPKFLRMDSEINHFLEGQYALNTNLDADLQTAIASLSEIWILRDTTFGLELAHRFDIS